MRKDYQVGIMVDTNARQAIHFLKTEMPGGFNTSDFCNGAILGYAQKHGFKKVVFDNGNPTGQVSRFMSDDSDTTDEI